MTTTKTLLRRTVLGSAAALIFAGTMQAQAPSYPEPTPAMQAGIDKDAKRHFGDAPLDGGPLATDLSAKIEPAAIDAAVRKVADWELKTWQPYFEGERVWTWSVLYSGFIAVADSTGDAKYRDAMTKMSKHFNYEIKDQYPNADAQSIGQTYVELYLKSGKKDKSMIEPTKASLEQVIGLDTLKPGDPRIPWWWCDALFMAPPLWARMTAATGDPKYLNYLDKQWHVTYDRLWDKEEHLYARDESYIPKRGPSGKKIFWSRGEGWVMGGLARTLEYMPKDDPRRAFYVKQLQEMAARVAELQGADGQWHADLLDPKDYPLAEVSGASLMVFGLAYGVNEGILDAKVYKPVIERGWAGILTHVYADGRLGCIQQTGAEPAFYRPTASYDYGVGGYLLAGAELKRMASMPSNGKPSKR
ncbi:Rhamnogalacturonyl hydrolase YesR [Granulicella rosea]|uniref:Rhamnogalacturonyl hydrolase YesR n=1 Tax=Granulicella rosea TaxID=474952 RepID=A0A239KR57_9BACT|nr:glycoside hydrolase family 88 protein [Granulicella rosea]SNT19684.1 Rhamnogalacturonyl hydrolase YesR [Granulicella rosea]